MVLLYMYIHFNQIQRVKSKEIKEHEKNNSPLFYNASLFSTYKLTRKIM
jgi:hypothetical protein